MNQLQKQKDAVCNYARVFCHFASLALEFKDGRGHGDGDRMECCWKFFFFTSMLPGE